MVGAEKTVGLCSCKPSWSEKGRNGTVSASAGACVEKLGEADVRAICNVIPETCSAPPLRRLGSAWDVCQGRYWPGVHRLGFFGVYAGVPPRTFAKVSAGPGCISWEGLGYMLGVRLGRLPRSVLASADYCWGFGFVVLVRVSGTSARSVLAQGASAGKVRGVCWGFRFAVLVGVSGLLRQGVERF